MGGKEIDFGDKKTQQKKTFTKVKSYLRQKT